MVVDGKGRSRIRRLASPGLHPEDTGFEAGDAHAWTVETHNGAPVTAYAVGGELDVATTIGSHRFVVRRA